MSVIIAGSVALDHVKTPLASQDKLLGGSASYASLAAAVFTQPVHLVGIIGQDFPQEHLDMLAERGVSLGGLERSEGESFTWSGEYHQDMNQRMQIREEARKKGIWPPPGGGNLISQETKIVMPSAFSPLQ